jgi:ABC-2 type transport system permease protein
MMNALRLCRRYLRASLHSQLQYPWTFFLSTFDQLLVTAIEFLGVWSLFHRFGSIAGWRLPQAAFLYGLADVSFACAELLARGFDGAGTLVRTGELDRILLRPRGTVLQLVGHELHLRRVGRLLQGLAVLIWASHACAITWSAAKLLLLLAALAGAACISFGLVVLQATSCFWTIEPLELWNAFRHGGNYMAQYPLTIYRGWFRRFFTFVLPVACVSYLPALELLERPDPLGFPTWLRWIAPLAGVLFLGVCLQIWRLGLRHYTSTGT